jgi:hypothetical protein
MGRKRRQLSKIFGFKEGNAPSHKGKKLEYECEGMFSFY